MDTSETVAVALQPDERIDVVNEQIRLIQKKQGLTFGTDAFLLAAYTRPQRNATAVDLGSGTGILPLLLSCRQKAKKIYAVEIQPEFAELIAKNAAINGMSDRVVSLCADARALTVRDTEGEVDLVLSNPPYMRTDSGKRNRCDEKYIARHEVFGSIQDFCESAGRLLRHGGRFVSVWRPDRLSELTLALRDASLEPKRMTFVHADAASEPCMVLTEAVKGAAPSLRVSPPLLLYLPRQADEKRRTLTPAAQAVYDECRLFY